MVDLDIAQNLPFHWFVVMPSSVQGFNYCLVGGFWNFKIVDMLTTIGASVKLGLDADNIRSRGRGKGCNLVFTSG